MIPNEPANFSAVFLLMKKSLIFRYVKYSMSFNIFTIVFPHIWPPKRGGTYRVGHLRPSVSFTGVNALQIQMVKLHVLYMSYNSFWALVLHALRSPQWLRCPLVYLHNILWTLLSFVIGREPRPSYMTYRVHAIWSSEFVGRWLP